MQKEDKSITEIAGSVMHDIREAENDLSATECHPKKAVIQVLTQQMQGQLYHLDLAVFTLCLAKIEDTYGKDSGEYTSFLQEFKDHPTVNRDNPLLTDCWLCESALSFVESAKRDLEELQDESEIDALVFSPVQNAFNSLAGNLKCLLDAVRKDAKKQHTNTENKTGTLSRIKF
jgi:hypothetical protein